MRKNRWIAAVLALLTLAGCGTKTNTDKETEGQVIEKPQLLTNVYTCRDLTLPEGYYINSYAGFKDGAFQFQGNYSESKGKYGSEDFYGLTKNVLIALPENGGDYTETVLSTIEIKGSDETSVDYTDTTLHLFDGGRVELTANYDPSNGSTTYDLAVIRDDGTEKHAEGIEKNFQNVEDYLYIQYIQCDGDDNVYLAGDSNIWVFDPELNYSFAIQEGNYIQRMSLSTDGRIYAQYYGDKGMTCAPIDVQAKKFGDPIVLPENLEFNGIFFGEGYTLYYYNKTGIYGYNTGDEAGVLLMNFQNSDVSGDLESAYYIDADSFLLQYYDRLTWDRKFGVFTKAADVDLSQITIVEIASAGAPYDLTSRVVDFNRKNKDMRVVYTDYSQYSTPEDYNAGDTKLANDILNGLYKPDIVIGKISGSAYSAFLEKGLFADYNTLAAGDAEFDLSDLFGCVKNSYTMDGRLIALPSEISVQTLLGNKKLLGGRTSWTLEEMLDVIDSLPEGVAIARSLTQSSFGDLLGENGIAAFVDGNECSFDSPTFIRLLEYLKTLPESLPDSEYEYDNDNMYAEYQSGKYATVQKSYWGVDSWFEEMAYFGADNTVRIGYPSVNGKGGGTQLSQYTYLYSIMDGSEYKDAAWHFVKSALHPNESGRDSVPLFRSDFEKMVEKIKTYTYVIYYNGGASWGEFDPADIGFDESQGIVMRAADVDWDGMEKWLDGIGSPVGNSTLPYEVQDIIMEEISSYMGGTKSASDTASLIQSRVKLYLAENS